jgi:SAM-dependent methyltransferase
VHYGCGFSAPTAWWNFDASVTLRFEQAPLIGRVYTKNERRFPPNVEYGDIVSGLPVPDGSCRAVYCSHVLEHLSLEGCRSALRNTLRVLRSGGTFRLVVPDLDVLARAYVADASPDAAHKFVRDTWLGKERRSQGLLRFAYEYLRTSGHRWMWDYDSMELELADAGFAEIRRAEFGDSPDPMFSLVEDADRWQDCLGVECRRP